MDQASIFYQSSTLDLVHAHYKCDLPSGKWQKQSSTVVNDSIINDGHLDMKAASRLAIVFTRTDRQAGYSVFFEDSSNHITQLQWTTDNPLRWTVQQVQAGAVLAAGAMGATYDPLSQRTVVVTSGGAEMQISEQGENGQWTTCKQQHPRPE